MNPRPASRPGLYVLPGGIIQRPPRASCMVPQGPPAPRDFTARVSFSVALLSRHDVVVCCLRVPLPPLVSPFERRITRVRRVLHAPSRCERRQQRLHPLVVSV